ncbi:MAG: ArsI/CadI family heavy metal resistance metalloenzyme [Pirellulaceae bacterium]
MKTESAVQFPTASRIHVALAVENLKQSEAFYRALFGQESTKTRAGYAKFEVVEPPVNLSLNAFGGETGPNNPVAHFGIQVKSTAAVEAVSDRLEKSGLQTRKEENVTCCYTVQNKVWAADPDGNQWEVYVVLDDEGAYHHSSQNNCCADLKQAVKEGDLTAAQAALRSEATTACGCGTGN